MKKILLAVSIFSSISFAYTLESGWNMVGNCGTTPIVVSSIAKSGDKVYSYDGVKWSEYSDSKKELSNIALNRGVWFYSKTKRDIDLGESQVSVGSYIVDSVDWNLLSANGYIKPSDLDKTTFSAIWNYSNGEWKGYSNSINSLSIIKKGDAFWINNLSSTKIKYQDPKTLLEDFFK